MPFGVTQDPREAQRKSVEVRNSDPIRELREIQSKLHTALMGSELTAIETAQLTRAYVEAEKLKRVIRGQAANTSQSIRSEPVKKSRTTQAAPMEWIEPEAKPDKASGNETG